MLPKVPQLGAYVGAALGNVVVLEVADPLDHGEGELDAVDLGRGEKPACFVGQQTMFVTVADQDGMTGRGLLLGARIALDRHLRAWATGGAGRQKLATVTRTGRAPGIAVVSAIAAATAHVGLLAFAWRTGGARRRPGTTEYRDELLRY